jgi:hypothetical protein
VDPWCLSIPVTHAKAKPKMHPRWVRSLNRAESAFGVDAGVNDAIHVEVEVVELDAVGVGRWRSTGTKASDSSSTGSSSSSACDIVSG